jgi:hypothetical protein
MIKYKGFSSKYELYYITWNGIGFDKDKLIRFIKRLKFLRFTSIFLKSHKEELKILREIYKSYDEKILIGLLNNDEQISKNGLIEKWSRIGAIDILLNGVYSRSTFTIISNLPIEDYQMVCKRIEELVNYGRNITYQKDNITDNTPGL